MLRIVRISIGIAWLAAFAGALAPLAVASRLTLRDEVEVRGDSIFLSDLLPVQAPAGLRDSLQGILVGVAPKPGTARVLDGAKILGLIGNGTHELNVPERIVVRRSGRLITRDEAVAAIRRALVRTGLPDASLGPDDLRVFPDVLASADDAALEVRRIDFDETLKQAKFLMAERGALPFLVTAQIRNSDLIRAATSDIPSGAAPKTADAARLIESAPASASVGAPLRRLASGTLLNAVQPLGPTLVEAGKPATLFLSSGTMQMLLDVTALDRGSLNQTIRVRLPGTGKVLRAQVSGARRLTASF